MPGDDWTRNATDPHAQYFVVKDFLLLLILKNINAVHSLTTHLWKTLAFSVCI